MPEDDWRSNLLMQGEKSQNSMFFYKMSSKPQCLMKIHSEDEQNLIYQWIMNKKKTIIIF